jgi:hypothetical protein
MVWANKITLLEGGILIINYELFNLARSALVQFGINEAEVVSPKGQC